MYIVLYKTETDYEILTLEEWLDSLNSVLKGLRAECVSLSLLGETKC